MLRVCLLSQGAIDAYQDGCHGKQNVCDVYLLFICFDPSGEFVSSLMQYGSGHCSTWVRMKQRAGSLAHAEQLIPVVEHVVCRVFRP